MESWVDLESTTRFQLMRAEDPGLLQPWIEAWSDLVEFDITLVQGSAEAAAPSSHNLQHMRDRGFGER